MLQQVTILFVSASPSDEPRLALDEEFREIHTSIRQSTQHAAVTLIPVLAARVEDLQQALLEHRPSIVHFSGHATPEAIMLVGSDGTANAIHTSALTALLRVLSDCIRLVVFNACFSHVHILAISEHIDFCIGMSNLVEDEGCIRFAAAFYQGISSGLSVRHAYDLAMVNLRLHTPASHVDAPRLLINTPESDLVLLTHRSGCRDELAATCPLPFDEAELADLRRRIDQFLQRHPNRPEHCPRIRRIIDVLHRLRGCLQSLLAPRPGQV